MVVQIDKLSLIRLDLTVCTVAPVKDVENLVLIIVTGGRGKEYQAVTNVLTTQSERSASAMLLLA